jgi:Ca-activated chloride channel family protein
MLAKDIAPNRLEKSKQIISKIVDKLGSDRVGIIIYAGNAYPLLPITTDHAAAKMFLQNANPDMVSCIIFKNNMTFTIKIQLACS